jgi:hypothetical protein
MSRHAKRQSQSLRRRIAFHENALDYKLVTLVELDHGQVNSTGRSYINCQRTRIETAQ